MGFKEKIIFIPSANETELLRTFARFNKNTFGVRILNTLNLASLVLSKANSLYNIPNISSEMEVFIFKKILTDRSKYYFQGDTILDAKNIRSAIFNALSLVLDFDDVKKSLDKSLFKDKNIDLFNIYNEYKSHLERNHYIDLSTIISDAIKLGHSLDEYEFITFNEFLLTPNEERLINVASGNNYKSMSFFSFFGIDEKESIPFKVQECHGEYNEVLNLISYISDNNIPLDNCLVVVTNPKYQSIINDVCKNLNIDMTSSLGMPISQSKAGKLLKALVNYNTYGMHGLDAIKEVFRYLDYNKLALSLDLDDSLDKYEVINQLIKYMGDLKLSFDKESNDDKLHYFNQAIFDKREKYTNYLPKLVKEIELGYSYIIDNYLDVGTNYLELEAKNKVVKLLEQYYFKDKEDYINIILASQFNSSLSKPKALYVTTIDKALLSLRPNIFILGMSSDYFPSKVSESYVILDSEYDLINPLNNITRVNKTKMQIDSFNNLISISNKLGININVSYSSYSVSDVKGKNISSIIYDYPKKDIVDYRTNPYFNPYFDSYFKGLNIEPMVNRHPLDDNFSCDINEIFNDKNMLSPSALESIFLEPNDYKFYLQNILGITSDAENDPLDFCDAAGFGNIIHEALEGFDRNKDSIDDLLNRGDRVFNNYSLKHFGADMEYQRKRMKKMLKNAYNMVLGNHYKSEYKLSGEISSIPFYGRCDRIEINDGKLKIIDFKTGSPKHDIKNLYTAVQGIIYARLLSCEVGYTVSSFSFYYLKSRTIFDFESNSEKEDKLFLDFKEMVSKMKFDINKLEYYSIIRDLSKKTSSLTYKEEKPKKGKGGIK